MYTYYVEAVFQAFKMREIGPESEDIVIGEGVRQPERERSGILKRTSERTEYARSDRSAAVLKSDSQHNDCN